MLPASTSYVTRFANKFQFCVSQLLLCSISWAYE